MGGRHDHEELWRYVGFLALWHQKAFMIMLWPVASTEHFGYKGQIVWVPLRFWVSLGFALRGGG
jgi:hypothetical protein